MEVKNCTASSITFAAEGKRRGLVDTNEDFYYPYGIKYKGLKLLDVAQTNIKMHFVDVAHFIDDALSSGGKNHLFVSILFMCSSYYGILSSEENF